MTHMTCPLKTGPKWLRLNRHSSHPQHSGCELYECQKVFCPSIISGGDAPEVFEFVKAALDKITSLVDFKVIGDQFFACPVTGNDRLRAHIGDKTAQSIAVIGFIGQDMTSPQALKQGLSLSYIAPLARRQNNTQWPSESVGCHVNFGGQSTSRTPQSLISAPPFPVAAC